MTVGLPGTGVGGMFYLLSALAMPLREAYGRARGRSTTGGWRAVLAQAGLALGILAGMWAAGWLLGAGVAAIQASLPPRAPGAPPPGNVLRTVALVISLGTLAGVLLGVELLGLWLGRGRRDTQALEPVFAEPEAPRRVASLVCLAALLLATPSRVATQGSAASLEGAYLARAESAYAAGDPAVAEQEYAAVLRMNPDNSRALYRLGELRRRYHAEALRLLRRYVELEPQDPWGYMAVGDLLARAGQYDAALAWYDSALRLAPGEADAVAGRARVLARRAQAGPAIEPALLGSYDSDGTTVVRILAALDAASNGARLGATFSRTRTGDVFASAVVDEMGFRARSPPRPGWNLTATIGAARLDAPTESRRDSLGNPSNPPGPPPDTTTNGRPPQDTTVGPPGPKPAGSIPGEGPGGVQSRRTTIVATGQLRARWRPAQRGPAADFRLRRDALAGTPMLVTNTVVRTEFSGMAELPLVGAFTLVGTGRAAILEDRAGENRRTAWGGGMAFPVGGARMSLQFQQAGFAHQTTAGYFAPRLAQTLEGQVYWEIETGGAVSIALDAAAGVQRVARHDAAIGPWRRAGRLYALVAVPLAPGRALQVEFEGEDSSGGSLLATSERWRYGSLGLSLRWAF